VTVEQAAVASALHRELLLPSPECVAARARAGVAIITECKACGRFSGVPAPRCVRCASREVRHFEDAGIGKLVSYSIIYVTGKSYGMYRPYAYVLVRLDGGATIAGWVLAEEIDSLGPGKSVRAVEHEGPGMLFTLKEGG
jgi:uncharacterized OB-fold protein